MHNNTDTYTEAVLLQMVKSGEPLSEPITVFLDAGTVIEITPKMFSVLKMFSELGGNIIDALLDGPRKPREMEILTRMEEDIKVMVELEDDQAHIQVLKAQSAPFVPRTIKQPNNIRHADKFKRYVTRRRQ